MKATNGRFEIECICENCAHHFLERDKNGPYWKDGCKVNGTFGIKKYNTCDCFYLNARLISMGFKIMQ